MQIDCRTTTSFYLRRTQKVEAENSLCTSYTCKRRRKQAVLLPSAWQLDPLVIKDKDSAKPENTVPGNEAWQTRGLGGESKKEYLGQRTPKEKHPSTCLALGQAPSRGTHPGQQGHKLLYSMGGGGGLSGKQIWYVIQFHGSFKQRKFKMWQVLHGKHGFTQVCDQTATKSFPMAWAFAV